MTEQEKKCWICHRTENEIIAEAERLHYEPICLAKNKKEMLTYVLDKVFIEKPYHVTVCVFCDWIIRELAFKEIKQEIDAGNFEDEVRYYINDFVNRLKIDWKEK